MLVISLLKAVPARTTKVVTVGGVLRREEMDLVMNPHDSKAIEAADYVKRTAGGKVVAITMGPEPKLRPIMNELYDFPIEGVDEAVVLSDRRMAGADTLATAYAVALGVKKVIETNLRSIDEVIEIIEEGRPKEEVVSRAAELYSEGLLPNIVYSDLKAIKESVVKRLAEGSIPREEAIGMLRRVRLDVERFIIMAGIKTTDGETGSTGPQVAEALSRMMGRKIPHLTYVHSFELDADSGYVVAERKMGDLIQRLKSPLPCLLTIANDYRPLVPPPKAKHRVRLYNYKGKKRGIVVWGAEDINADPSRLGLAGSPTIVGPGVDVGAPPTQKFVGQSKVFVERVGQFEFNGKKYGPFDRWSKVEGLPSDVERFLEERGYIKPYTFDRLLEELFGGLRVAAEQRRV